MTKAFADYTFIAGNHSARGSLWQGPDHLLVVEGRGWLAPFVEVYRRVDYSNIQSLTLVRTSRYLWLAVAWGLGALIFGLFALLARSANPYLIITLTAPAVLLFIGFVVHLAKGPTCACALQTSVQLLRLRPLHRLRIAQPVMEKLQALCRQHQGELSAGEAAAASSAKPSPPQVIAGAKPPWTGTVWTVAAGALVLAWGLVLAGELFVPGVAYTLLDGALGTASLALTIVALARALRMRVPGLLLGALWGSLAMEMLAGLALYALAVAAIVRNDVGGRGQFDPGRSFDSDRTIAAISNFDFATAGPWAWGIISIGGMLALLGLILLAHGGRKKEPAATTKPEPPPPMPAEDSAP